MPRSTAAGRSLRPEAGLFELLDDETVLFLLRSGIRPGAGLFGVSERTLRRRFQQQGLCLSDLLSQRRRTEALRLLAGNLPLKSIAVLLGFASTQTLARYLRREFGVTATVLRKELRPDKDGAR
jgi:hypothetical protein